VENYVVEHVASIVTKTPNTTSPDWHYVSTCIIAALMNLSTPDLNSADSDMDDDL